MVDDDHERRGIDWRHVIEPHLERLRAPSWSSRVCDEDPTLGAEIVEELSQHLQDRYDELRAGGASADEAYARARAELDDEGPPAHRPGEPTQSGPPQLMALRLRQPRDPMPIARSTGGATMREMLGTIWQDARYAARTLRKRPVFSAVVILTLALGIGATTAIFSVVDAVMLRPFPYPDIDRILILNEATRGGQRMSVSWQNFQDWRDQNQVFDALGVYRPAVLNLTGGDQPERLNASIASSGVFGVLGIQPQAGRAFQPADDQPTAARVALISDRIRRSRFNADPSVLGRQIQLNGQAYTIVGVMPATMRFPSRLTDLWLPLGLFVDTFPKDRGAHPGLTSVGRLKAGVSIEQATAQMDAIARRLERQFPDANRNNTIAMMPYYEQVVQNVRPALLVLLAAVATILLTACTNLASLLLAQADRRQREIAVRAALGAERGRLARQLLTESVMLAVVGGAAGALLAAMGVRLFVASDPTSVPRVDLVAVDLRVLAFAAAVSVATGILFGLAPALRGSSPDVIASLQTTSRGTPRGSRLTSALVVAEIGLALVLLVAAGLTIKGFAHLMAIDPGFDPERVVTMRVTLPDEKYPDRARWTQFHQDLLQRVLALPAVDLAALISALPLEGVGSESAVLAEGERLPTDGHPPTMCLFQTSTPDYFRAMGIPIVAGRSFTDRDTADSRLVAVVDETLARKLFPTQDPIGKRVAFEMRGAHARENMQPIWREVVGVVHHVRHYGLATDPPFVQIYAPMAQLPLWFQDRRPSMALVVRTRLEPQAVAASIRSAVASIDRDIPLYAVKPMSRYLSQATEQPRLSVTVLGSFGALALVLAMLGIYGLLSYAVAERRQEIGIRLAFGATRADVLRLIVGRGMLLTALGLAVGLAASWLVTQWLRSLLFDVSPHDAMTFASMSGLVVAVAFLAAYIPARRATRVDPVIALRCE